MMSVPEAKADRLDAVGSSNGVAFWDRDAQLGLFTHYLIENSLIKRSADKVHFSIKLIEGDSYSDTLDNYYGEGRFTYHDDGTVTATLCYEKALKT